MADFLQLLLAGPGDRRDLCAGGDRLHAALADVADHQLRAGRVRDGAGLLRADRHELFRPAVLAGGGARHPSSRPSCSGLLFKRLIVDPMLRHGVLPLVIATIALAIFCKEAVKDFYSAEAQPFPPLRADDRRHRARARPSRCRAWSCWRRHRRGRRPAAGSSRHAHRPHDAGDGAEPHRRAHPGHAGRAHDPLHLPDQRRARRASPRS